MDKKKKDKGYRGILIATVVLGVLLLLIVAFSIFFFYKRIAGTKGLMSDEAHEYDSYYVLITDSPNTDFWQSVYQGAVAEAEKHNAYVEFEDCFS